MRAVGLTEEPRGLDRSLAVELRVRTAPAEARSAFVGSSAVEVVVAYMSAVSC